MILITGSKGQLGTDFQKLFDSINEKYIAVDYEELDITNIEDLDKFFKNNKFDIIINCAAYNNVDKAEEDQKACFDLNTEAPFNLSDFAKEQNAIFVTYSTDFVFDGENKNEPFDENDTPNPPSIYAQSKYNGEQQVLNNYNKSFVIRTSWVFGKANNNFNKQIIQWSKGKDLLKVVDDQISVPTYSKDLAYFSWKLIKTKKYGLYHISNDGECSKYEQAKYVLDKINWNGNLETCKTEDFNLPAKRSFYSKISSKKIESLLGEKVPSWQDAIDRFLTEIEDEI